MARNIDRRLLWAAVVTLLVLPACKKENSAPVPPPHVAKGPQAGKPVMPQQQISSAAASAPVLDFKNRTDPFKPFVAPTPSGGGQPVSRKRGETLPIQSYEVTRFRVVGVITGFKENRALVIGPNGKGYVISVGMAIGNNNGHVTKITPTSVEVTERFSEGRGKVARRKIVLTLPKKR